MVRARSWARTAVRHLWAKAMKRKEQTVRPQRRAWDDAPPRQRGPQRQALPVEPWFPLVLGWVVRWWQGPPLALALDAPALGTRVVGLALSGLSRGGALPVAGVGLAANPQPAWRRAGLRLVRRLRPAIPRRWPVIVLPDRGLAAPGLVWRLVRLGCPPFWRLHMGGLVGLSAHAAFALCRAWSPSQVCAGAAAAPPCRKLGGRGSARGWRWGRTARRPRGGGGRPCRRRRVMPAGRGGAPGSHRACKSPRALAGSGTARVGAPRRGPHGGGWRWRERPWGWCVWAGWPRTTGQRARCWP
jgi:hypothetical protein